MRRVLTFSLLALSPMLWIAAARGDGDPSNGCATNGGPTYRCQAAATFTLPGVATPGSSAAASGSGSQVQWVPYERLMTGPDGKTCKTTGYRAVPPGGDVALAGIDNRGAFDITRTDYPDCPPDPARPAEPESPRTYAVRFWQEIPLPVPNPKIAPGRAITGKLAYLETRGEMRHSYATDTPVGPLRIEATGEYHVDWGDGSTTGPYTVEGHAWPDGEITHQYIDVGNYDVVVTERWTATWTLGAASGRLTELRTVGRIDNFPVQQIQAVILR